MLHVNLGSHIESAAIYFSARKLNLKDHKTSAIHMRKVIPHFPKCLLSKLISMMESRTFICINICNEQRIASPFGQQSNNNLCLDKKSVPSNQFYVMLLVTQFEFNE